MLRPGLTFSQHLIRIFKHTEKLKKFTVNTHISATKILQLTFFYACFIRCYVLGTEHLCPPKLIC